ncbi:MAG: hypothetical protein LBS53_03565 [Synergistaceae bacterium]|jgi:hypothetical protein|nr:hypothetical protein [Synergistaceae bacterium]
MMTAIGAVVFIMSVTGLLFYRLSKGNSSLPERYEQYMPHVSPQVAGTEARTKSRAPAYRGPSSLRADNFTPVEKDFNLRSFQVVNPEGEVHTVNTADSSSFFYGQVWTRILDCYRTGEFLRARARQRYVSRTDGRFSGYQVSINGVEAFLPRSKAEYFYDPEQDATGKCLALQVEMVHPNGPKQGTVIVNAKTPWKYTLNEFKNLFSGKTVEVLALDYVSGYLVFPGHYEQFSGRRIYKNILVRVEAALRMAGTLGIAAEPGCLTGLYWKLQLQGPQGEDWLAAPLEVLI